MELHRGHVQKVRFSTHTTGNDDSVSTHHIAAFELDGIAVQVVAGRPVMMENGDEVIVAGKIRRGVLMGVACNNLSRKILDHRGWMVSLLVGVVFSLVGLVGAIGAALAHSPFGAAFFLVFAAVGAGATHGGMQILRAKRLVLAGA
jgi:hypothetical protein